MKRPPRVRVADVYGDPERPQFDYRKKPGRDPGDVPHGTEAGYQQEYWKGLPRCRACKAAHAELRRRRYRERKGTQ